MPAPREIIAGQTQLSREDIHRPEREQTERDIRAGDPIDYFVDRAITARGDHVLEAFLGGRTGQRFRFAPGGGGAKNGPFGQGFDARPQTVRTITAGRRIQDNDGVFQLWLGRSRDATKGFNLFFKLSQGNLPA